MPPQHGGRLLRLLTTVDRLTDLLPELQRQILTAVGGVSSVILHQDTRSDGLFPLSGYRVESLPLDPWLTSPTERAAVREAMATGTPILIEGLAARVPHLARSLNAPAALVVPVRPVNGEFTVLVVGLPGAPSAAEAKESLGAVVDALALALQRSHLQHAIELQRELRTMLDAFTRAAGSNADVTAALAVVCEGAVRLFAADRAELWLHDRRTRELVCGATSAGSPPVDARVSVEDVLSVAATALRRQRSELVVVAQPRAGLSAPAGIAVPLRGRRRALGTLLVEGVRIEPGSAPDLLARADELGRQLSSAIENAQLLRDVLASRRQLEIVLDSIDDLVVVCDVDLNIVRANESFAARTGTTRAELADRPLAEFVDQELHLWVKKVADASEPEARMTVLDDGRLQSRLSVTVRSLRPDPADSSYLLIVAKEIDAGAR